MRTTRRIAITTSLIGLILALPLSVSAIQPPVISQNPNSPWIVTPTGSVPNISVNSPSDPAGIPVLTSEEFASELAALEEDRPSTPQTVSAVVNGVIVTDVVEAIDYAPIDTDEDASLEVNGAYCYYDWEYGNVFGAAFSWLRLDSGYCNTTVINGNYAPYPNNVGLANTQVTASEGGSTVGGEWATATSFGVEYQSTITDASLVGNTLNVCIENQIGNPSQLATCAIFEYSPL